METMVISERNPLIVTDQQTLRHTLVTLLEELGFDVKAKEMEAPVVTEVTTRQAKKLLKEKGYRVVAGEAFKRVLGEYNIQGKRKGKDDWYQVSDLNRVPSRL